MFGLSFSNPSVLHGLWAALLPLAIHLLNRRRALTVPFSNVSLLQTLQYDRMRRVKLRQILLLVLRTLLIVLLVLAFARPALLGVAADGAAGAVRSAAVLLLDRSLSMRYQTPEGSLFERSVKGLREALGLFDARDQVHVVLVDDRAVRMEAMDAGDLKTRVEGLKPSFRGTDFRAGLEAAIETLARSETLNRELYVFSDFARNGWASLPDTLPRLEGLSAYLVPSRPGKVDNLGISKARPVGQILTAGSPATLEIELVNHGEVAKAAVPLQVYLGSRRIAQQLVSVGGRDVGRFHVRFTPEAAGPTPLRVEVGDDDLSEDNVFTSVLTIPEQVAVLLVGEDREETYYIERALSAAADARGTVSLRWLRPRDLTTESMAEADVVFLCNVPSLARGQLTALRRRVSAGMGVMICLGDKVDVRHYNDRLLAALLPSSLNGVVGTPGRTETHHTLRTPFPSHPLFLGLTQGDRARSPRFFAYYRVRSKEDTQPVTSLNTGSPAFLEGRIGAGHVVLFASGIQSDLGWTDLPLSGLFVPLMHRISRYLASGAFGQADYTVGQSVYRDIRGQPAREALLSPPSRESRTIWPEQRGGHTVWPAGEVDLPGLWEINAQARTVDRFAVQLDADEADLAPFPSRHLQRLLAGARVHMVESGEGLAERVLASRYGRELWRETLALALAVMVAEMLLARSIRTSRDRKAP